MPSRLLRSTRATLAALLVRVGQEFRPPQIQTTPAWAEEHFRLPAEGADMPGRYRLHYAPYLWGIFAALDDPAIPEVVVQKAAQVGWTFGLVAYLGRRIDNEPCPIVMLFAADEAAREFVDEKLVPSIEATPALRKRVDTSASTKSGNRALFKKFAGGFLKLGGSRSIFKVKSTPARLVIVEEPDDTKENLKEQGDAISLLWERTKRMSKAKRLLGGTPTVKGLSRVEEHAEVSDKRVLPVLCHGCGDSHVLDFDNVTWDGKDAAPDDPALAHLPVHPVYGRQQPDTAIYCCPHCGEPWDDHQRKENIRNTVYAALQAGDKNGGWVATAPFHGAAGFIELNELYSCLPGAGVVDLVRDYLQAEAKAAKGDENGRIVFINSKLARTYEYQGDQLDHEALAELADDYAIEAVPPGGLLLTVGVDVQDDRLAVIVRAWGRLQESWLVYWGELQASVGTHLHTDPVWAALDKLVFNGFPAANGARLHVSAITIDASDGGNSDAVYNWVRTRSARHRGVLIMAGKGSSATNDPEIFTTPRQVVDHRNPNRRTKADRHGVKVFIIGTNKAKDWIFSRIGRQGVAECFHFTSEARPDYCEQITAEVKAPHRRTARMVYQLRSGRRNEALDCEVYALHAARAKRVHLLKPAQWDAIEAELLQPDMLEQAEGVAHAADGVSQETPQADGDSQGEAPDAGARYKVKRVRGRR